MLALKSLFRSGASIKSFNNQTRVMLASQQNKLFSAFVNHRDTHDNHEATPFEFTNDNYK